MWLVVCSLVKCFVVAGTICIYTVGSCSDREKMVHLSDYVRRLQQNGHSRRMIVSHLSRAGAWYGTSANNHSFGSLTPVVGMEVRKKYLLAGSIIFFVILMGVLSWFFFAKQVEVTLMLQPMTTTLLAGQTVVFEKVVTASRQKTPVEVTYEIVAGANKIVEKQEKLLISGMSKSQSRILLPNDVQSGDYVVKVAAVFDGREVHDQFKITVNAAEELLPSVKQQSSVPETTAELAPVCAQPCTVVGPCLSAKCVRGACVSEPITSCCGNGKCESVETPTSCATDCGELAASKETVVETAKSVVKRDVGQAVLLCNSLIEDEAVDSCIEQVSRETTTSGVCDGMRSPERRDSCYMQFALNGDFSGCDKIVDRYQSNSCSYLEQAKAFQAQPAV